MNQRLNDKLSTIAETLAEVKTVEELQNTTVEIERLVLKSNFEDFQSGKPQAAYEARDYVVGERNTRGLSWKLNLLRMIAEFNFCKMVRVGVHGGQTKILGQPENIDTTLTIYHALVPAYENLSKTEFTNFSDGQSKEEGAATVHRVGWINAFLLESPVKLGEALKESRERDAGSNGKIAGAIAEMNSNLTTFQSSLAPAKAESAPKAEKAPKSKKSSQTQETAEGETVSDTPAETNGENAADASTATEA